VHIRKKITIRKRVGGARSGGWSGEEWRHGGFEAERMGQVDLH
jgi:hypothetical protein